MKKIFAFLLLLLSAKAFSQDTAFNTVVTACNWSPDGRSLLLKIVKFDKAVKGPPAAKSFLFDMNSRQLQPLFEGASGLAASPDGRTIALCRQNQYNKGDLYLYDLSTKELTVLLSDSSNKSSPCWSPDGKEIVFNRVTSGSGPGAVLDIYVINISTKKLTQITRGGRNKSYNPMWAPEGDKIVYYVEKGDDHDQVWLTDSKGSFHTNLTNDMATHNFYPSWIDKNTIIYTQGDNEIMAMSTHGNNKRKIEDIHAFQVKYNPATRQAVFLTPQPDSKLVLYDWKKKTTQVLIDRSTLKGIL